MMGHVGSVVVATCLAWAVQAETPSTPRVARVVADRVYVRCGPSTSYYPTAILKKGDRVRVVSIRPDGWAAIEPPPGSFCWVNGDFVRIVEPGVGEAIEDDVWVWIGSTVSPKRDHSQVRLRKGQRVRVLKSSVFAEDALQRVWLQIEPPEGEVRWVKVEFLEFEDSPTADAQTAPRDEPPPPATDVAETTEPEDTDGNEEFAMRLFREAEEQFSRTMQLPPGQRDLLPIKAKYEQVLRLTDNPALKKVVHTRLATLDAEELRERLARRFLRLLEESRAKDRQLLELARKTRSGPSDLEPEPAGTTTAQSQPSSTVGFDRWFDDPFSFTGTQRGGIGGVVDMAPPPSRGVGQTSSINAVSAPQFGASANTGKPGSSASFSQPRADAAIKLPPGYQMVTGVLHPEGTTPQGRARYVVRDPRTGRALGYVVEAPGLNLRPYIGKVIRITGRVISPPTGARPEVMARRVEPVFR